MRTQVGIVGAGPAGLMLSHLLHLEGIDSIILENRSRSYIEGRIRAGLIEHWARDLLIDTGVGERLQRESLFHHGIHFCFDGALHHIDFQKLVGKGVTVGSPMAGRSCSRRPTPRFTTSPGRRPASPSITAARRRS